MTKKMKSFQAKELAFKHKYEYEKTGAIIFSGT